MSCVVCLTISRFNSEILLKSPGDLGSKVHRKTRTDEDRHQRSWTAHICVMVQPGSCLSGGISYLT